MVKNVNFQFKLILLSLIENGNFIMNFLFYLLGIYRFDIDIEIGNKFSLHSTISKL